MSGYDLAGNSALIAYDLGLDETEARDIIRSVAYDLVAREKEMNFDD